MEMENLVFLAVLISSADSRVYAYQFLTELPDMNVMVLPEVNTVRTDGKVDTAKVVQEGMKNARSVGAERDGKILVKNRYTGKSLHINSNSIRHSLNGSINRLLTNARIGAVVGDMIQNAVPINALHNKAHGVYGTYAMAQYATDSRGREFLVIITAEQKTGNISDIEVYDVAHAVSGRQKKGSQASTKLQRIYSIKATTISIAELLKTVKETYQSILSEDVLRHFSESRNTGGEYFGKAKFSVSGSADILRNNQRYLELAKDPEANREQLQAMVEQAAREAGYDSPVLYHGTKAFGFTEFDLDKMDDKATIFLTDNRRIASTYAGVDWARDILQNSNADVENMDLHDVAKKLQSTPSESGMRRANRKEVRCSGVCKIFVLADQDKKQAILHRVAYFAQKSAINFAIKILILRDVC